MKKIIWIFTLLINSIIGFSQTDFTLSHELIIKDYYHMNVLSTVHLDNKTYICCLVQDENINVNYPVIYTVSNNQVDSKIRLKPKDEVFFSDIKIVNNHIMLIGATFTGNDEEMQGYVGYFDFRNKEIWNVKLEKYYEGIEKVFLSNEYFEVITNGENGLFAYKIDYQGKVLIKKAIEVRNYIHDALKTSDFGFLILADSLNSNGESIGLKLTKCDSNYKILQSQQIQSVDRFLPVKLMEYNDGYIIAGNIDSDRSIPLVYFIGLDLRLKNFSKYHFEPEHYMFKSDFRIRDIIYSQPQKAFIACGLAKIVNDETNIIFTLNENKLVSYKLLDKTGLWGNNKINNVADNSFDLIMDFKINDDFDTKIKMIEIKR
jgi:hypothetical protein